jgi:hypothetical protein
VSESRGDDQAGTSGPSQSSNPPQGGVPPQGSNSPQGSTPPQGSTRPQGSTPPQGRAQSRPNGQPGRAQPPRASDPVADLQRWLMKAGARSMANQVADQVKRTIGTERRSSRADVWDTATNEPPPDEAPECQWCPVCQAARAARLGGAAGLGAQLANAGGVLASVVQDAFSAFEQAMKTQDQNRSAERPGGSPPPEAPKRGEDGR